jgi:hypothetical protein
VPIDAVTVAVAPAASEPLADDSVTHVCVFAADQLIEAPPVFVSVYCTLAGLNGPPTVPEDVSPVAGATDIAPAAGVVVTVKLTGRVVFPVPLVVFVKVTVSL